MITRNPDANFSPDLCSRVTFVNFTVTKAHWKINSKICISKVREQMWKLKD